MELKTLKEIPKMLGGKVHEEKTCTIDGRTFARCADATSMTGQSLVEKRGNEWKILSTHDHLYVRVFMRLNHK